MPQNTCEKVMPKLDLTRFHGADDPSLFHNRETLDVVRTIFAEEITTFAISCSSNIELLDALYLAMPPHAGLGFPRKIGQGSTRNVYELPFGMVLKLERTDPPDAEELARCGSRGWINYRRTLSNITEMTGAIELPQAVARVFGVTPRIGKFAKNISCIVMERLSPLTELVPDDSAGIPFDRLALSKSGQLKIFDDRFPTSLRSESDMSLKVALRSHEEGIWLGNIGHDEAGRYFLMDASAVAPSDSALFQIPECTPSLVEFARRDLMDQYQNALRKEVES